MAGAVGIDPLPLTYRELVWMYLGRQRAEWERTAALLACIHNVTQKTRVDANDYNPYAERKSGGARAMTMRELQAWTCREGLTRGNQRRNGRV